jgi:glycosyltransferase involved in cell wall biosynthesis
MLHRIRMWDARTSNGVDEFIAISKFVARRIWKVYRRTATVIYPPVGLDDFPLVENKQDFYLTASRLVPYKGVGTIVEAFSNMKDRKLVVIGNGPEFDRINAQKGANVEMLGHQPTDTLRDYLQRARAFVFAAEEDFGIVPLEAQAAGTPVVAYGKGGALETIRGVRVGQVQEQSFEGATGVFFDQQSALSIAQAISFFETHIGQFKPSSCRQNADRFSRERFKREFSNFVAGAVANRRERN